MPYTQDELEFLVRTFRLNYHKLCFYCGAKLNSRKETKRNPCYAFAHTIDHVIPKARNGSDSKCNKVNCCFRCNSAKADLTLEEFRQLRYGSAAVEFFFEYDMRFRNDEGTLMFPVQNLDLLPKTGELCEHAELEGENV
jgi:hypothetical protein